MQSTFMKYQNNFAYILEMPFFYSLCETTRSRSVSDGGSKREVLISISSIKIIIRNTDKLTKRL